MVRVWRINRDSQILEASMKDHKGSVNAIQVRLLLQLLMLNSLISLNPVL
jgi:hypothetical protein